MTEPQNLRINHLLDALPADVHKRLFTHLERVSMPIGEVLYEAGDQLRYAYFPTNCIVSMLYITKNGMMSEMAAIGNDGLIGIALFLGGSTMPNRAVVQSPGCAYRLSRQLFMREFNRYGSLYHLFMRYTQVLIIQIAQTAVCNRYHSVVQQLCRRLLISLDRDTSSNELTMTQELIANMLGVRREGVTEAAGKLQRAGLIEYSRGHITVLDRQGLEARACECYKVVKTESDRLFASSRHIPSNSRPEFSLFPLRTLPH